MVLWSLCAPARAEPAPGLLELGLQTSAQAVWQALRVRTGLPDDSSLANLPDDPAGWRATPATLGNLGPQRQPVALQLEWVVAPDGGGAWILEIDYPSLDHIELELTGPDGQRQTWTLGDHHRFSERAIASRAFAVPLVLQEGQRYRLTGVVRTTGSMILPIQLERPEVFWLHESREQLLQGGLCGALLCLLVYVLSQGRALRDAAHFWYSLNVLGTTIFFFSYQGLGVQHLWGELDWAGRKMTMLAGLLGLGSAFMYVDTVLELRQRTPWLSHCMRGLAAVLMVTLGLFALGLVSYRGAHLVNVLLSPAPLLMALPTAWRLARAGDRVARFLLVGWAVFGACAMCFTLLQRGLLPVGFWTGHAFQFGTLVELTTWMMMLATRTQASKVAGEMAVRERDLLATIAHTDALTGLLNRRGLQAAAEPMLARCEPTGAYAVFLIDLDRFKPINDRHGHDAGDAVLRTLGQRLKASLRSQDVVARLGGDEFVVVAGPLATEADAGAVARKLLHAVTRPFDVNGLSLDVGMTVGYALAPQDSTDLSELLKRADAAMYSGKLAGRGGVQRSAAGAAETDTAPRSLVVP
jgi:diguanylate cyclase (GGDEF)-like protein